jgi:hypothetical protein
MAGSDVAMADGHRDVANRRATAERLRVETKWYQNKDLMVRSRTFGAESGRLKEQLRGLIEALADNEGSEPLEALRERVGVFLVDLHW